MKIRVIFFLASVGILFTSVLEAQENARTWYQEGRDALKIDDYYGAVDAFRAAIRINPAYSDAQVGMIHALYLLGEYEEAYNEIEVARVFASGERDFQLIEARVLVALGRHNEGREIYLHILSERPHDPDAIGGLAEIHAILGQKELAEDAYRESLVYAPSNLRILLQLMMLHDDYREKEQAEAILEDTIRLYPMSIDVHIRAIEHYAEYDNWDMVSHHLDRARNIALEREEWQYNRVALLSATLLLKQGRPQAAINMLDTLTANNENPDVLFLRARAYRSLGMESDAQKFLHYVLEKYPDNEITRIFREHPLAFSIGSYPEHRQDAADWHVRRGHDFESQFYFKQAMIAYRRARRLYPTDAKIWLDYANSIRLNGFPHKYADTLRAAVAELSHPEERMRAQERLALYEHASQNDLAKKWSIIDPWGSSSSSWRIGVFFVLENQNLGRHTGAEEAVTAYFADLLDARPEVNVLNFDGDPFPGVRRIMDYTDAFREARNKVDYFVIVQFSETSRSFSADATIYLGQTGKELQHFAQVRSGQGMVHDALNLLAYDLGSAIPMKAAILDVDEDHVLIDKGKWHGVNVDDPVLVLQKGFVRPANDVTGIDYPTPQFLGTVELLRVSESLSEGFFTQSHDFSFVSQGDEVFFLPAPESVQSNTAPDPAFRSRMLAVP